MGFKFIETFGGQPVGPSLCGGPLGGPCTGGVTNNGMDIHFHGPDLNTITGAYDVISGKYLNGYEASMAEILGTRRWEK